MKGIIIFFTGLALILFSFFWFFAAVLSGRGGYFSPWLFILLVGGLAILAVYRFFEHREKKG